jgi:uncharacterized protein DUF4149
MIRWLFQFLLVLSISLWVGAIAFFSAVVAPGIFTALDRPAAGNLLSQLFPRYYQSGALCGAVALLVVILLFLFDSGSRGLRFLQLVLVLLMLGSTLYAGWMLEPQIHGLRQERVSATTKNLRDEAERRFQKLHTRSVELNLAVLSLWALWRCARKPEGGFYRADRPSSPSLSAMRWATKAWARASGWVSPGIIHWVNEAGAPAPTSTTLACSPGKSASASRSVGI